MNNTLFPELNKSNDELIAPLAYRLRPTKIEDFAGGVNLFKKYPFLESGQFTGVIFSGPTGSGKTTLAKLLASKYNMTIYEFNAVLGGVADLKKLIHEIEYDSKRAILFIDEIHRFNKASQDALLPYLEKKTFLLIGATTNNPRISINKAVLSRSQIVYLSKISSELMTNILAKACLVENITLNKDQIDLITRYSVGDARRALNYLEIISKLEDKSNIDQIIKDQGLEYDKNKDYHFNTISAFIKSLRGSDPDAAILYLAQMLNGGEDPIYIARRLIIFASEDIGNADPTALNLAVSVLNAVKQVGMPEARIPLAQATTYLAATVKSNAAYEAINEALKFVKDNPDSFIPEYLKNHSIESKNYKYPHSYLGNYVEQKYTNVNIPNFYSPTNNGLEEKISKRLKSLRKL